VRSWFRRLPGILAVAVSGCALTGTGSQLPARIEIERGGFVPEGIEYDTQAERFLVGSLVDGTIYEVGLSGALLPFVIDPELESSVGIETDEAHDRLFVANADDSVFGGQGPGIARLGVYRLSNGARVAMIDLAAVAGAGADDTVFVNDVTVDGVGNAYVTDTFMNQIYRVDTNLQPSVLYRFEPTTGLGLNGIVHHDAGFLIVVAIGGQGLLYKVPLDNPAAARPIALSQPATGADGLVWDRDGRLIVVSNSSSSALAYTSSDGWNSADLVATASFDGQATTAAATGEAIYVVQPHFNDAGAPVVLRADFESR